MYQIHSLKHQEYTYNILSAKKEYFHCIYFENLPYLKIFSPKDITIPPCIIWPINVYPFLLELNYKDLQCPIPVTLFSTNWKSHKNNLLKDMFLNGLGCYFSLSEWVNCQFLPLHEAQRWSYGNEEIIFCE
jgi:hypothetical protein